ncbi:hypothetical protein FDP41_006044 [Naegleria fowleri]|uniref:CAP-Gly domain-containing protein n=1 Tax=Naegleria fowleri TaxID=5763 RepID=A0A6A5BPT1_NAEFO|nr:uncharacterized protein FDP41_006044 [Naegleria fowleri]KAF0974939.1 hypothetical protein FDP41_006044 [Naegleria fowleri]
MSQTLSSPSSIPESGSTNQDPEAYSYLLNMRFEYNISTHHYPFQRQGSSSSSLLSGCNTTSTSEPTPLTNNNYNNTATSPTNPILYAPALRGDLSRGFVRYIGTLQDQPKTQLFVGVEWDYEVRGKHDGELNGVRYFKTSDGRKSASFIKLETFLRYSTLGVDFLDAVHAKYKNKDFREEEMYIYSATKKDSNFKLGLQESKVSKIQEGLGSLFGNVKSIDLTANLITSWSQVEIILKEFPKLQNLILSSNRFSSLEIQNTQPYVSVKILVMNDVAMNWGIFAEKILPLFPQVEEVHFRDNNVTDQDLERTLLNYNSLKRIQCLNREEFPSLKSLSVTNNNIEEWDSINELNKFSCLEELRLDNNAIQEKYGVTNTRQGVIARIKSLQTFNGSEIKKKEREDAEKYYLKQCGRDKMALMSSESSSNSNYMNFLEMHPRYEELVSMYGDPCENESSSSATTRVSNEFVSLYIKNVAASVASHGHIVEKKIPYGLTIKKLKLMCQRLFKLDTSKQHLFYVDVGHSLPEPLSDDFKDIDFYAVKDGGTILMEEIDEVQEQRKLELAKKEKERSLKEQEEQVAREMRWKHL